MPFTATGMSKRARAATLAVSAVVTAVVLVLVAMCQPAAPPGAQRPAASAPVQVGE